MCTTRSQENVNLHFKWHIHSEINFASGLVMRFPPKKNNSFTFRIEKCANIHPATVCVNEWPPRKKRKTGAL